VLFSNCLADLRVEVAKSLLLTLELNVLPLSLFVLPLIQLLLCGGEVGN
jgi:hypothetical protein